MSDGGNYLASILDEAGKAGSIFKQVLAAELCRKMEEMHEEVTSRDCAGCQTNHPSQLRHACCGYGEYFRFHANLHGRLYIHKAIEVMDKASLDERFAKGLYLVGLPQKHNELSKRFKKRAELSWFSEIWDLIRSCKIDSESCLFPFVTLPPRASTNIMVKPPSSSIVIKSSQDVEEALTNDDAPVDMDQSPPNEEAAVDRKSGDGDDSSVSTTTAIVGEIDDKEEANSGKPSKKKKSAKAVASKRQEKGDSSSKGEVGWFGEKGKDRPSKPTPSFVLADPDEEPDEAAEAEVTKREKQSYIIRDEAVDEDQKLSDTMI
ncbi:MAG: hypothetical protein GY696_11550, partial [Gammaproteobacteria bacterium]|nr:hypothetical protein [Gammaproteobacteria bacterium]